MFPIFSPIGKLLAKEGRKNSPIVKKPRRVRLAVEELEDRTVPTVTTNPDLYTLLNSQSYSSPSSVLDNDSNTENLPMTAELVQGPEHAGVAFHADGNFDLTPDGYKGYDQLIYKAIAGGEWETTYADLLYTGVVNWTGNGGDLNWTNAANWNGNIVPGMYDDVIIDVPGITIVIPEGYDVTIRSLQCAANLQVDLTVETGTLLSFQLADDEENDQLVIHGHLVLSGLLEVGWLGTELNPGDEFDIISFYSLEGTFDNNTIDMGNNLYLQVLYLENKITLRVQSYA